MYRPARPPTWTAEDEIGWHSLGHEQQRDADGKLLPTQTFRKAIGIATDDADKLSDIEFARRYALLGVPDEKFDAAGHEAYRAAEVVDSGKLLRRGESPKLKPAPDERHDEREDSGVTITGGVFAGGIKRLGK